MRNLAQWIVRRPRVVIAILVTITVGFAVYIPRIRFVTNTKDLAPENDPIIKELEETIEEFGSQEIMMVVLKGDIFTRNALVKVDRLTTEISRLHGVKKVMSPLNVDLIKGSELGIEIQPIVDSLPETPEEIRAFRERLEDSQQGASLVASNGRAMAIIVTLEPGIIATKRAEILAQEVETLANREKGPEEIYVVGEAYMGYWASKNMRGDLRFLFPLVLAAIVLALYLSFRSLLDVLVLLASVITSIVWTVGLMAALGYNITMVSMILPIILIAMGSAAGIHILNRFHEEVNKGLQPDIAIADVVVELTNPILMTSLTTAVGFGSLVSSFVPPVKEFGIFAAIGIMLNMVISLTLIPSCLAICFPSPGVHTRALPAQGAASRVPGHAHKEAAGGFGLKAILEATARLVTSRPRAIISGAIVVLVVFAVGIPKVHIETNIMQYFRKDSPVVKGTDIVERDFGGTMRLSVVVDSGREDGIKDPAILNRMLKLQGEMDSLDKVSNSTSVANLIREVNCALHGDDKAYEVIPNTHEAVAQELLLFTMQSGGGLDSMVSYDFRKALITASLANVPTSQLKGIIDSAENLVKREFDGTGATAKVVGLPKIMMRLMDRFMDSQLKSLFWSMLGVWVVVSIIMGSVFLGSLCLIPLVLTVVINFGVMGYMGIPLDVVTMMIAGICIGIGIDYSIHLISRYRLELSSGIDKREAIMSAVGSTGRGIFFNAATMAIGFGLLIFSSFHAISVFGALVAGTMATSSLGALIVLPSVLRLLGERQVLGKRAYSRLRETTGPVAARGS
ncbi:MAG: RND family transporter [Firmicutes bacterium]|nr:RND family transporter [Bacillota bacterium]